MKATYRNKKVEVLEFLSGGNLHIRYSDGQEDYVHTSKVEFEPKVSGRERSKNDRYGR